MMANISPLKALSNDIKQFMLRRPLLKGTGTQDLIWLKVVSLERS